MSRSKKITDALSELKRTIKDRDATIKSLERQLRKLNDELTPVPKKEPKKKLELEESDKARCPTCQKNTLKIVDLGPSRQIVSCSTCSHRLVIKRG